MRSALDINSSSLTHLGSLGIGRQGMRPTEFESDGRSSITYMLENNSPRLDSLNEYRPQETAVDVKTVVHKILVQIDCTSVGKAQ